MNSVQHSDSHYHPAEAGVQRLAAWLALEGYHSSAVGRICEYTRREETPTGAPDLDVADEEPAEHAYVEGCEAIHSVDPAWDEFDTEPGRGPVYNTVEGDYELDRLEYRLLQLQEDAPTLTITAGFGRWDEPAPISGVAPDAETTA